mmetsp:Transcript_33916/g.97625  ORF Transcript_33916/g.97625 Transcript_33916/m.97625 type:complete len:268 (-) Transcript_33916:517-1320(-)
MDLPKDVLPMPGGPWRQRIGPFMSPRIFCTAKNSSNLVFTLSKPLWSSSSMALAVLRSTRSSELVDHGNEAINSKYVCVVVYSGWCGCKLFNRFKWRFAIRDASSGKPALSRLSANLATSSSSSSSSGASSSPEGSALPPSAAGRAALERRSRASSRWISCICRWTRSRLISPSRDFCMSAEMLLCIRCASHSLSSSSRPSSRRRLVLRSSSSCCRSDAVSCRNLEPMKPMRASGVASCLKRAATAREGFPPFFSGATPPWRKDSSF